MKTFNTKNLVREGETVYYKDSDKQVFVARFKYNQKLATRFMRFLRSDVTVENYFAEYKAGNTPLSIVRARGFV